MAYEYIDILAEFGITPVEEKKVDKKAEKKGTTSSKSSKKTTTAAGKEEIKFKLPVTVYTGYGEKIVVDKGVGEQSALVFPDDNTAKSNTLFVDTSDMAVKEYLRFTSTNEITLKELHKFLSSKLAGYPENITILQKGSRKEFYLVHNNSYVVEKAKIQLKSDTRMILGDTEVDLSAIKTAPECEVSCEDLQKLFAETFPDFGTVGFIHSSLNNVIVPSFRYPILKEDLSFPVSIEIFGREGMTISRDEYSDFVHKFQNSKPDKAATQEDDDADAEVTDGEDQDDEMSNVEDISGEAALEQSVSGQSNEVSKAAAFKAQASFLSLMVVDKYPDFAEGHLELQWNDNEKIVIVKMIPKDEKKSYAAPDETYPTDALVSLIYTSFRITPELFGGKPRVSKEELREYIEKERPEYSKERTDISYDKALNMIVVVCRGSRKGIDLIYDDEVAKRRIEHEKETLFLWQKTDGKFRVEKTKTAVIIAPVCGKGEGSYKLLLPKIPIEMINIAKMFFIWVYREYGTEVMLQLFWDAVSKQYFWNVPKQQVCSFECLIDRDTNLEMKYTLVADFHSHGCYEAFFSQTDNEDELGFRIYGVLGNMNYKNQTMMLRAGTGGCYVSLNGTEIFDNKLQIMNAFELYEKLCREARHKIRYQSEMVY